MKDCKTEKDLLLRERAELRQRISDPEKSAAEHQQSDEALRESEERYKTLLETTGTGYLILATTLMMNLLCKYPIISFVALTPTVR